MNREVAVYMNDESELVSFPDASLISVYLEESGAWKVSRSFPIYARYDAGPVSLRQEVTRITGLLDDCRIIAGGSLPGLPFGEFDRHGFSIFDISGIDSTVLNGIARDIEAGNAARGEGAGTKVPIEISPGVYYLDLIALQAEHPTLSSKQAVRDFLDNTPFLELQLLCSHVPPWLENGAYDIRTETTAGALRALLRKKTCGGE